MLLESDELIIPLPVLTALFGALAGAFFTNAIRSLYDRRAKVRDAREALVGEAHAVISDAISTLILLYGIRRHGKQDGRYTAEAEALKALGKVNRLNSQVWQLFPEWYAADSANAMAGRFKKVLDVVSLPEPISDEEMETALSWAQEQQFSLIESLALAARVRRRRSARALAFLGFRRRTRDQLLKVAKQWPGDPAPWECYIKCRFSDSRLPPPAIDAIERKHMKQLIGLRCSKHKRRPHVLLTGSSNSFSVQIESCCDEFQKQVAAIFHIGETAQD